MLEFLEAFDRRAVVQELCGFGEAEQVVIELILYSVDMLLEQRTQRNKQLLIALRQAEKSQPRLSFHGGHATPMLRAR